jgi:two-component system nitrogen regulation response regulator GlnG
MGVSRALTNTPLRVSAEALELLIAYRWPGNLDELQSVLQRALIESKGTVQVSDYLVRTLKLQHPSVAAEAAGAAVTDWERFAQQRVREGSSAVYAEATAEMERHLLNRILNTTQGNQARAAKILGITRGSLRKKIRTLGIALPSTSLPAPLDHDDIIADS